MERVLIGESQTILAALNELRQKGLGDINSAISELTKIIGAAVDEILKIIPLGNFEAKCKSSRCDLSSGCQCPKTKATPGCGVPAPPPGQPGTPEYNYYQLVNPGQT